MSDTGAASDPLDEVWKGDLLGRRREGELLAGYLESIAGRVRQTPDRRAFTLAIDASYGQGKTFFLRRFSEQLALSHPVAFVDAWSDDLADEPLIALVATIKAALEPLLKKPKMKSRWDTFMSKTGTVSRIVAAGLAKKGLGLLITGGSVEALGDVMTKVDEDVQDAVNEGLDKVGDQVADGVEKGLSSRGLMAERIANFEAGQQAVKAMKESLSALIAALPGEGAKPPIFVFVDELDRCRPTYAIKLLEEIKHLFDVPGIVFVFGLHGEQLAHSASGAYGPNFDGRSYLKRFFDRTYLLAEADLEPLVETVLANDGVDVTRLDFPTIERSNGSREHGSLAKVIANYMRLAGLQARDAFEVVDVLQTCLALTRNYKLVGCYLLPLIMGRTRSTLGLMKQPMLETGLDGPTSHSWTWRTIPSCWRP